LTGKPMYEADNVAQLLYQIAQVPHAPLLALVPAIPQNVARAIERGLVKDPEDRTPDIVTFVHEFSGAPLTRTPSEPLQVAVSRTQLPTRQERIAPKNELPTGQAASFTPKQSNTGLFIVALFCVLLAASGAVAFAMKYRTLAPVPRPMPPEGPTTNAAPPTDLFTSTEVDAGETFAPPTPESAQDVALARDEPKPRAVVKGRRAPDAPLTEEEEGFLAKLTADRNAQNWENLMAAQKEVLTLPRASGVRRRALLLVFEAACARHETTMTALFNRLAAEHPDSVKQALEACHRHLPGQVFDTR
jgi:hypothetical protein